MKDGHRKLYEEMERVRNLASYLSKSQKFSSKSTKKLRSQHPFVEEAKEIQLIAKKVGNASPGYDGLYLSVCATYELTFRASIESLIESINTEIQDFSSVPRKIREWHPKGCAHIIHNSSNSKFEHLTVDSIVTALSRCQSPNNQKPAQLLPDAFSWHENNLRHAVVGEILTNRIGIEKPWKKIAKRSHLKLFYGTDNEQTLEKLAKNELDSCIERRNNIIHRGRNYYTSSESDITRATHFFEVLTSSIVDVLYYHKQNM